MKHYAFDKTKTKKENGRYKYVYEYETLLGESVYLASIPKYKWHKYFRSEKEAAIGVDKMFIEKGKQPINILKKVVMLLLFLFIVSCNEDDSLSYADEFTSEHRYTYQFETNAPQFAYIRLRVYNPNGIGFTNEVHEWQYNPSSYWVSFEQKDFFNKVRFDEISKNNLEYEVIRFKVRIYEKDNVLKIKYLLTEREFTCGKFPSPYYCKYQVTFQYDKSHTMQYGQIN